MSVDPWNVGWGQERIVERGTIVPAAGVRVDPGARACEGAVCVFVPLSS